MADMRPSWLTQDIADRDTPAASVRLRPKRLTTRAVRNHNRQACRIDSAGSSSASFWRHGSPCRRRWRPSMCTNRTVITHTRSHTGIFSRTSSLRMTTTARSSVAVTVASCGWTAWAPVRRPTSCRCRPSYASPSSSSRPPSPHGSPHGSTTPLRLTGLLASLNHSALLPSPPSDLI